ncbi:hypothetical protein HETIRDRAFT_439341 [Heterobasidion irregulare TC 32-1]|uniref:Uncharacterized protein n=1 Tax=Heterobasidion irregulare (strain TC 32-1) TaxID=747525 RepID=W4KHF5_HETIT|nr:uncharacterized protein HETIRDRAFT_439341 [Heterobasidion irregulare TC 32-1]ETW84755.1 hypothetical protein HETIRDRAFT_439341 [Heterobasidion irregulare TC 32-1]
MRRAVDRASGPNVPPRVANTATTLIRVERRGYQHDGRLLRHPFPRIYGLLVRSRFLPRYLRFYAACRKL